MRSLPRGTLASFSQLEQGTTDYFGKRHSKMAEGDTEAPPFSGAQLAAMEAMFERVCDRRLKGREDGAAGACSDTAVP